MESSGRTSRVANEPVRRELDDLKVALRRHEHLTTTIPTVADAVVPFGGVIFASAHHGARRDDVQISLRPVRPPHARPSARARGRDHRIAHPPRAHGVAA